MHCNGIESMMKILAKPDTQYYAGIMQRHYEWKKINIETFIDSIDFIDVEDHVEYALNSVITKKVCDDFDEFDEISITDGQQRFITITLFITALCAFIKNHDIQNKKVNYKNIMSKYLLNITRNGDQRYKLRPRGKDFETLKMLINDLPNGIISPKAGSSTMIRAYKMFYNLFTSGNYEDYYSKLRYLTVVNLQCEEHEDENRIFSNINTGGRNVDLFTKIKAYALGRLDPDTQELYYKMYFADIEERDSKLKNGFAKAYLLFHYGNISRNQEHSYTLFKRLRDSFDDEKDFFKDFSNFREYFLKIHNNSFKDKKVNEIIETLKLVLLPSHYSLIIRIIQSYENSKIDKNEFISSIDILRRVGLKTSIFDKKEWDILRKNLFNYINWFSEVKPFESIIDRIKKYAGIIPSDEQFENTLLVSDMYTSSSNKRKLTKNILLNIENNHMGAGRINSDHFSIEHICPQTPCRLWSGIINKDEHNDYVHSLGNLTLLAKEHNSLNSNASFEDKKMIYENDKLYLSNGIAGYNKWDADNIQKRTKTLSREAVEIFSTDRVLR